MCLNNDAAKYLGLTEELCKRKPEAGKFYLAGGDETAMCGCGKSVGMLWKLNLMHLIVQNDVYTKSNGTFEMLIIATVNRNKFINHDKYIGNHDKSGRESG